MGHINLYALGTSKYISYEIRMQRMKQKHDVLEWTLECLNEHFGFKVRNSLFFGFRLVLVWALYMLVRAHCTRVFVNRCSVKWMNVMLRNVMFLHNNWWTWDENDVGYHAFISINRGGCMKTHIDVYLEFLNLILYFSTLDHIRNVATLCCFWFCYLP